MTEKMVLKSLMVKAIADYLRQHAASDGLDPVVLLERKAEDATLTIDAQRILLRSAAHLIVTRNQGGVL